MICCKAKYNAGMLKSQIVIQRKSRASDGMGGYTESWSTIATVRAKFSAVTGSERYQAMQLSAHPRAKAVIRFKGDSNGAPYYTAADRVLHKGRYWAIEGISDPDDREQWLELNLVGGDAS